MKNSKSYIESISMIIASLVAAGGFVWGIIEFQQRQFFNETHEFRRKIWERKLETYTELQNISGNIIIYRNKPEILDSLLVEFEHLYYSAMIMVEDSLVESKVIAYREALNDFKEGIKGEQFLKKKQIEMMRELSSSLKRKQKLLFDE